jgi:hypothetical protein
MAMHIDPVIAAKVAIAALGVVAALAAACNRTLIDLPRRRFDGLLYGAAAISRLGLFLFAYVVLGFQAQSDALVYYDWSRLALAGHIPGESDVLPLHYGPLFLYLMALPLLLVDSSRAIVALTIAIELISIPIWLAVARTAFSEVVARRGMLLYVASPFSLLTSVIGANNDVIVSLFMGAALWLLLSHRELWSGLVLGLGVVGSKLLVVAALPALLLKARRPVAGGAAFAALPTLVYGAWVLMGIDPLAGLHFHAQHYSSGNLPFLAGLLRLDLMKEAGRFVANALGALLIGGILALALMRRERHAAERICALVGALFAAFMLTSAKAFAHYWIIALVPVLCVLAAQADSRWPLAWYAIFSFTASVESTLWFRLLENKDLSAIVVDVHAAAAGLWLFLPVEMLLLASYCMILFYCCRGLFDQPQAHRLEQPE